MVKDAGGNKIAANILAALSASLMYFATWTDIPILEGLLGAKKTLTYAVLVIVLSAVAG